MPRRPPRTLRALLEAAVGHLEGIRRAVDTGRGLLTVQQAARLLQVRDDTATVWLREQGLVREICGRDLVVREELLRRAAGQEEPARTPDRETPARRQRPADLARGFADLGKRIA